MNVYRITVSYENSYGHLITFTQLYVAKNFDLAVNHARSIRHNRYIPGDAKYSVVGSCELIGNGSIVENPEPDTSVNGYKEFCRDLKDWVNNNPQ